MRYPVQAFEVLLAGFKPAACDLQEVRVPYCPQWSMEAIWTLTECVQGKLLYASTVVNLPCLSHLSLPSLLISILYRLLWL